ncbi:MAG: hypothetical protein M3R04_07545 [bacterium]|nr:hypothetical protein [bacterium]
MSGLAHISASQASNPLLRHGWQHDGRRPRSPLAPGVMPQKVPIGSPASRGLA